jgi:hypothetical protein
MAVRKAALGLLLACLGAWPAAAEPPALEGNRFVFHRPRNVTREYTVRFDANGTGTLLIDVLDERRTIVVPGKWSWRDDRLCLEFPPTFNDCVLLLRNRGFFLMAKADTVERRSAAAADPARIAREGSWGSNPDLLGAGIFVAGR